MFLIYFLSRRHRQPRPFRNPLQQPRLLALSLLSKPTFPFSPVLSFLSLSFFFFSLAPGFLIAPRSRSSFYPLLFSLFILTPLRRYSPPTPVPSDLAPTSFAGTHTRMHTRRVVSPPLHPSSALLPSNVYPCTYNRVDASNNAATYIRVAANIPCGIHARSRSSIPLCVTPRLHHHSARPFCRADLYFAEISGDFRDRALLREYYEIASWRCVLRQHLSRSFLLTHPSLLFPPIFLSTQARLLARSLLLAPVSALLTDPPEK